MFLKGCHLSCLLCHNPEGQGCSETLWHSPSRCIDCRACEGLCPEGAISFSAHRLVLDRDACALCGKCVEVCPTAALEISGRRMTAAQVLAEVEKDRPFYQTSGGGVSLSGGDPLYQHGFSSSVLSLCRASGLPTAVETSLFAPWSAVEPLIELTDLFLVDVKLADAEEHERYTGRDNRLIWDNLRGLRERTDRIIVRIPLIPGMTATRANVSALAGRIYSIDPSLKVEVVNYNPLAESKYRRLGRAFALSGDTKPLSQDEVRRLESIVRERRPGTPARSSRRASGPLLAAVDIGGTKTKLVIARPRLRPGPDEDPPHLEPVLHVPTPQDPDELVRVVVSALEDALEGALRTAGDLAGIGVGCPGPLDQRTGEVLAPPALPRWDRFPLVERLSSALKVPVSLENDGNAGALGEAVYGSAKGFPRVFYMTISTGIGTGIVIDRKVYGGAHGLAGEIWAFDPQLFLGAEGTIINDIASGSGLVKQAARGLTSGPAGASVADAVDVMGRAKAGDTAAMAVVEKARDTLSASLTFVVYLLDPDVIVLGGGMCRKPEEFVIPVARRVRERLRIARLQEMSIRRASLWDEAVLYGALALIEQRVGAG